MGANEAPPAVVSIFLGDELTAILESIENDTAYNAAKKKTMKLGVDVLPKFPRDTTDRNRTSPFAFTGNKFEFRMLGSSNSIACANIMLNSAVAESLKIYADRLENVEDFETALHEMIKRPLKIISVLSLTETVMMIHGSKRLPKTEAFLTIVQLPIVCLIFWMKRM